MACHFALALQRQSQKEVLLADFDLDAGIIGFLLKSKSPYSILDAAGNLNRLDFSYWKALISNGIPGIEVIKAPAATGTRSSCDPASLRHILAFVRCHYDYVVADLGRSLSAVAMNCLEEVDTGVVVTTPDVPSLHYAQHIARVLKDAGCGEEKIRLVLNRVNKRMEITREEIEQLVNLPLAAVLPEDYQALYDAYAGGELMPPETALSTHIAELAGKLGGFTVERKTRRFGLFG